MDFTGATDWAERALVGIVTDDDGHIEGSSGVLVRLSGRDFIFTGGHCVRKSRSAHLPVFLQFPVPGLVLPSRANRAVTRIVSQDEPDVAVLVLNPEDRVLWRGFEPVLGDEIIGPKDADESQDILVLLGFPAVLANGQMLRDGAPAVASAPIIENRGVAARATSLEVAADGIFVDYGQKPYFGQDGMAAEVPDPVGISGGPLFAVNERRRGLLGLARSIDRERHVQRFEPIAHALRLLLELHEADLSAEVERVLARL